ncbi:hypothetical protein ACOSQ3_005720 [Xanthoceras sorbifolium]
MMIICYKVLLIICSFDVLCKISFSVLYKISFFDSRQLTPFACKRLGSDTGPQQRGAGHCGAFVLMYAKYIVAHRQKFDFKANQMKVLRRKMSIEIFANSTPLDDDET